MKRRAIKLWLILVATLLAAWFAPEEQDSMAFGVRADNPEAHIAPTITLTEKTANTRGATEAKNTSVRVLSIQKRSAQENDAPSPFAFSDWQQARSIIEPPNPAPVQADQPQPELIAPPLPFKVMGRYIENGQITVFLSHFDRTLIVREGEILAESYKVERIDANAVHLRYLPLDMPQVLETGNTL